MALTRDQILSGADLRVEEVPCPELGGGVKVRTMTGAERFALSAQVADEGGGKIDPGAFASRVLAACIVDDAGQRIFADDDAQLLGARSAAVFERLWSVAQRLNGLGAPAVEAAQGN